ncbi:hypothetical protein ACQV5M_21775, partial [Leptospira sp. SA-E8]|uniref:hypothetical protein n=1 Tax=Leptospira sp. SA-E8 TaxID=3422259 RepID=UPI003EBD81D7
LLLNVDFRDTQRNADIARLQGSMSGATVDGKDGITSSFQLAVHRTPLARLSGGAGAQYLAGMEGNADITATLDETPQRLAIALRIEGRDVRMNLKPDGMGQDMQQLLASVLAKIDLLTVDLDYVKEKGKDGKTSTRMKSNLEPILNARLQ